MDLIYIRRNYNRLMRRLSPPGKMYCAGCDSYKDLSEFGKRRKSKYGVTGECLSCLRENNSSPNQKYRRFFYHKQKNYGIDRDTFNTLYEKQEGRCAICGEYGEKDIDTATSKLHVDHDHETNEIRGLLCSPCNAGLGCFRDDTERMRKAIDYLNRNNVKPKSSELIKQQRAEKENKSLQKIARGLPNQQASNIVDIEHLPLFMFLTESN